MNLEDDIERVLFDADEIRTAIRRIADDVTRRYRGRPLCIVAVLKGSCLFAADLIRCIPLPLELAFAGVSSYGANDRPGTLAIEFLPSESEIARRDVLLVDDILDTGKSMERLRGEMLARGAREVKTCVLLDKPARREAKCAADFVGFEIEDRFVVGYGLDFAGRYRNLPYVGVLRAGLPRSAPAGRGRGALRAGARALRASGGECILSAPTSVGALSLASQIPIPPERIGMELDEFLCLSFPLLNKGFLRRQVRDGRVLVDGNPAVPSQRLRMDQILIVEFDETEDLPDAPVAPSARIPILYEDEHVLAIDKPSALAVEPERWSRGNASVAGALLELALARSGVDPEEPAKASEPGSVLEFRPRIVHRLDKDTSGVLLVAKTVEAERALRAAFDAGEVEKTYFALVEGEHPLDDGESEIIDLPIGPDERKSGRMHVDRLEGKPSRTRISVERRFRGYTLLACSPLTGRTHQIRVHLMEAGFPLAVDPMYGRRNLLYLSEIKRGYRKKPGHVESPLIDRLTLHARSIDFPAPDGSGRRIRVESPMPSDLERLLKQLGKVRPL